MRFFLFIHQLADKFSLTNTDFSANKCAIEGQDRGYSSKGLRTWDLVVYSLIVLIGVLQFLCYLRSDDFLLDATYIDLAKAILEKGRYVFDFSPETLYPPGFPFILAIIGRFTGLTQTVALQTMAISSTLALMATYELLRRTEGRVCGACVSLLLGTTWTMFLFGTRIVFSDLPYFAVSTLTLLVASKLASERRSARLWIRSVILAFLLAVTLMVRSAGIALLVSCFIWLGVSFVVNPKLGRWRLRSLWLPIIFGVVVQFAWAEWAGARQVIEWSVGGWPQPYMAQLKIKSGNEPDLGKAQLRDIPERVGQNLVSYTAEFVELMEHKYVNPFWSSPAILGVLALLLLGLLTSLWPSGGELHDWYFVLYSAMYLIWPWDMEERFILPIVPLMALYVWRGGRRWLGISQIKPEVTGWLYLVFGLLLTVNSAHVAIEGWTTHQRGAWQALLATAIWIVLTATGVSLLSARLQKRTLFFPASPGFMVSETFLFRMRLVGGLAICFLIARGITSEASFARANFHFDAAREPTSAEIEADKWVAQHTPLNDVIMARRVDLAFHYSGHRVIWFPPTTNTSILVNGILKYHVGLIVVIDRPLNDYWRPVDQVSFHELQVAYPSMFRLVHQGPGDRVFEVMANRKKS